MFRQLLLGFVSSLLVVPPVLAGDPVDLNTEIVYLTDCGEYVYSTMGYYSKAGNSGNGQVPEALASFDWVVRWEGSTMVGTFPDGDTFTSMINWGADHLNLGAYAGTGANKYRKDFFTPCILSFPTIRIDMLNARCYPTNMLADSRTYFRWLYLLQG